MIELWLKFQDENGEVKRILIEPEKFTVGRHSENNLSVANGKLSREHLKIDRFGDIFIVSDSNSSNGTTLNGADLAEPVALKNEDKLNLGGGLEIEVEIISDDPDANPNKDSGAASVANDDENSDVSAPTANIPSSSTDNSISLSVFWLAPILGLFVLIFAGGLLFVFSGNKEKESTKNDGGFVYSTKRESTEDTPETNETPTPKPTPENLTNNSSLTSTPEISNTPPIPQVTSEADKIGRNASSFMRHIAFNDPKPFLTTEQIEVVNFKNRAAQRFGGISRKFQSSQKRRDAI